MIDVFNSFAKLIHDTAAETFLLILLISIGLIISLQGINILLKRLKIKDYLLFISLIFVAAVMTVVSGRLYFFDGNPQNNNIMSELYIGEIVVALKMGYPLIWFNLLFLAYSTWITKNMTSNTRITDN